jgi:hypothetical protein
MKLTQIFHHLQNVSSLFGRTDVFRECSRMFRLKVLHQNHEYNRWAETWGLG